MSEKKSKKEVISEEELVEVSGGNHVPKMTYAFWAAESKKHAPGTSQHGCAIEMMNMHKGKGNNKWIKRSGNDVR